MRSSCVTNCDSLDMSNAIAGRGRLLELVPAEPLHPLRPRIVRPQLAVLAREAFDSREPAFLDDLATAETHVEQMLHAPACDATCLRCSLRPVLAVVLFEDSRRTEDAAGRRDHEIACLARQVAIDEGEPPDLRVSRVARDAQRELRKRGCRPSGGKDVRMPTHLTADRTKRRFGARRLAPGRVELEKAGR